MDDAKRIEELTIGAQTLKLVAHNVEWQGTSNHYKVIDVDKLHLDIVNLVRSELSKAQSQLAEEVCENCSMGAHGPCHGEDVECLCRVEER